MKKFFVVALIAVALALASVACGDNDDDAPPVEIEKAQHSPNTPMFAGKTATITTNDTFTDTQWNAIVTAIVGKFSAGYDAGTDVAKNIYEDAFNRGITIIVQKIPDGYTNYKVSSKTLYVRAYGVNNLITDDIAVALSNGKDLIDSVTPP